MGLQFVGINRGTGTISEISHDPEGRDLRRVLKTWEVIYYEQV
jgi:hypothetical protein